MTDQLPSLVLKRLSVTFFCPKEVQQKGRSVDLRKSQELLTESWVTLIGY